MDLKIDNYVTVATIDPPEASWDGVRYVSCVFVWSSGVLVHIGVLVLTSSRRYGTECPSPRENKCGGTGVGVYGTVFVFQHFRKYIGKRATWY